jgi:hypothetical protein
MDESVPVSAPPLILFGIVGDLPTLHLYGQNTVLGMGNQEIALAILFVAKSVGSEPGARIENDKVILKNFGQLVEHSDLGLATWVLQH